MTKMMRRIDAERKRSWYSFRMRGLVTKKDFFAVAKAFGWKKAFAVLLSPRATALAVLMA